jgi:hypothetical protein
MSIIKLLIILLLSTGHCLISPGDAISAQDAFDAIRCGNDIPKALIGKTMPSGRVVAIESKHRNIGLKDEGSTEVSNTLFTIGWLICGSQYELLVDKNNVIRDVLLFAHSRRQPAAGGSCMMDGREIPDEVLAILNVPAPLPDNQHYSFSDTTLLPAIKAWRVDEVTARFVELPAERVRCPRKSIYTRDGGP